MPEFDHYGRARSDRRHDRRQHVDRRRRAIEMPAAVVRNPDAVGAQRHRTLGVLRMQDALDHERPFPAIAQPRQFLPGVAAARAQLHHFCGRVLVRLLGVGHEVRSDRHAVAQKLHGPGRRGQHLIGGPRVDRERHPAAVADVARALRLAGAVDGRHQHVRAGGVGAAHQVVGDGVVVIGKAVELEPEHVRRDRSDLLDRGIGGCRQHVGDTPALRLGGEQLLGPRPHQAGRAHGGDADRCGVCAAEQFGVGRHLAVDAVVRQQLDRLERRRIARDAIFFGGAAINEIKAEARHPRPGAPRAGRRWSDSAGAAAPQRHWWLFPPDLDQPSFPPKSQ